MPFNPETEKFYRDPSTIIDSGPGADTVKQGFEDRVEIAVNNLVEDLNLLKTEGMIGVGVPATETARGIARVATAEEVKNGVTGINGPAFVTPEQYKANYPTAKNIPFDPEPSELTATNTQAAIDEAVIEIPKRTPRGRQWKSSPLAWQTGVNATIPTGLNLSQSDIDGCLVVFDAKMKVAYGPFLVGSIFRNILSVGQTGGVFITSPITVSSIDSNNINVTWPITGVAYGSTYLNPTQLDIIIRIIY